MQYLVLIGCGQTAPRDAPKSPDRRTCARGGAKLNAMQSDLRDPLIAWRPSQLSRAARYGLALLAVGLAAALAASIATATGDLRLSMIFLGAILVCARFLGSGPAWMAATSSFLIFNYFIEPPGNAFNLDRPHDLLILVMYAATAAVGSNVADRLRAQTSLAQSQADAITLLYEMTTKIALSADEDEICDVLAKHLAELVGGQALVQGRQHTHAAPGEAAISAGLARAIEDARRLGQTLPSAASLNGPSGWRLRPLRVAGEAPAVAAWRAGRRDQAQMAETFIDVAALALQKSAERAAAPTRH